MYKWSNPNSPSLETLHADGHRYGSGARLHFRAAGWLSKEYEDAEVFLKDGDIKEVIFRSSAKSETVVIGKNEAKTVIVGKGENETRDVTHFLRPGGPAPTMRLGITKHRGLGTWSSLPHDFELNPEVGFEEVFFHILTGGVRGREPVAWQRGRGVWHDGKPVDEMWPVKNHTFSTIPMGYHPVVGEPGVHVSYVWVYLAKHAHWEKIK